MNIFDFWLSAVATLLVLGIVGGALVGWFNLFSVLRLRRRTVTLETELRQLRQQFGAATSTSTASGTAEPLTASAATPAPTATEAPAPRPVPPTEASQSAGELKQPSEASRAIGLEQTTEASQVAGLEQTTEAYQATGFEQTTEARQATGADQPFDNGQVSGSGPASGLDRFAEQPTVGWLRHVAAWTRDHWMVWLGGISVGLAGIFLVHYSIEQGYLGPAARIALGLITAALLHGVAEFLYRRVSGSNEALAALAGGASLIAYAAVLAALHLYELWPPALAFLLLAGIALGTLVLALRHGPILAALGLLGAYAVPALLGGDSGQFHIVLVYSLIVALTSLALMRYVYRHWLWWGNLIGAGFWWWVGWETSAPVEAFLGLYLAVLAAGMLLLPQTPDDTDSGTWQRWLPWMPEGTLGGSLLLLLVAQFFALAWHPDWAFAAIIWLPVVLTLVLAAARARWLWPLPWGILAATALGWLAGLWLPHHPVALLLHTAPWYWQSLGLLPVPPSDAQAVLRTLLLFTLIFTAAGLGYLHRDRRNEAAAALGFLAPLIGLALAQALVPAALPHWLLSGLALLVGLTLGGIAAQRLRQGASHEITFWLLTGTHLAYSLAVVMVFDAATLTVALAVQILSLTWLVRRFAVTHLDWLVQLALAVIVLRLSLNPWLLGYAQTGHWTLWTYGGSLLLVFAASRLIPASHHLRSWLSLGAWLLLLLFLHAEIRYWLYAGDVFSAQYGFLEVALNTSLWAGFALLYYQRAQPELPLGQLYRILAATLMVLAVLHYGALITRFNPLWHREGAELLGTTPILNLLWLTYALPALFWWFASRYFEPKLRFAFAVLTGFALWLFVTLQVRHLWKPDMVWSFWSSSTSAGEVYSYSAAWLLMAVAAMLTGSLRGRRAIYRGGLLLLTLVILKIFLVDLHDLTGLLRALSFLGLGLALLGLAFVHQQWGRMGKG